MGRTMEGNNQSTAVSSQPRQSWSLLDKSALKAFEAVLHALAQRVQWHLKRPQVIETRAFPRIDYALITAKTQVKFFLCNI